MIHSHFHSEDPPTGGGGSNGGTPNWPPDPPTNPGGGGGNNPPGPTNCTGVNECRPGSQIVEGKVPCGGCGSGPITTIPIDDDPINSNGYYLSRINQLDSLLNSDEFGIVPCDSLILIAMESYGTMYQDVASHTASPSILQRLDSIRIANPNPVWFDNYHILQLGEASGAIVNCDYFPIQINSFPLNPQTGVAFTPADYLENFRFNINSFITSPISVSFSCISNVTLPTMPPLNFYLNDCSKFSQLKEKSIGAIWHINIPGNDGAVIISGYEDTIYAGGSHHINFTVSTLETPFDFEHPVAGNRRFGLFNTPGSPNTWTFYTAGVDRIENYLDELFLQKLMFSKADSLWKNVLGNVANTISNSSGGSASFYNKRSYVARPKWNIVEQFLRKEIELPTLKTLLGC